MVGSEAAGGRHDAGERTTVNDRDVEKVEIDMSGFLLDELMFGIPFAGIIQVEQREDGSWIMVFHRVEDR